MTILGIDPGTRKVGYAVVDPRGTALEIGIEPFDGIAERVGLLVARHAIGRVAIGTGTNAAQVIERLASFGLATASVDERETTLRARSLYFADHPPRGWRRLIPLGMQLPPRPIDDYAALLIARRYLEDEGARGVWV
jgi:RNase H-fold protein (predicted Holliday junction resolvase)